MDALPAPHPAAARRHGGHGRVGTPRVSDTPARGGQLGAARRPSLPCESAHLCASPVSMRAFFRRACGGGSSSATMRDLAEWGCYWDGGMGAVESDGGFVRFVCRAVGVRLASTRRRPVCHRRVR